MMSAMRTSLGAWAVAGIASNATPASTMEKVGVKYFWNKFMNINL
jgi:hypothetical protein